MIGEPTRLEVCPACLGAFLGDLTLSGKAGMSFMEGGLKRPPRGYDPTHPHVEDLKRKNFAVFKQITEAETTSPEFLENFASICQEGSPLVRFLCIAIGLPY